MLFAPAIDVDVDCGPDDPDEPGTTAHPPRKQEGFTPSEVEADDEEGGGECSRCGTFEDDEESGLLLLGDFVNNELEDAGTKDTEPSLCLIVSE